MGNIEHQEAELIEELAAETGIDPVDSWGRSTIVFDAVDRLDRIVGATVAPEYSLIGWFGEAPTPLLLSEEPPEPRDVGELTPLAANERQEAELLSAATGHEVARQLRDYLVRLEVRFDRHDWIRTTTAFMELTSRDWLSIAREMQSDHVTIGDTQYEMDSVAVANGERIAVRKPREPRPDGEAGVVWDRLQAIGDASAWLNIAVAIDYIPELAISLHADYPPDIPIALERVAGGTTLWAWLNATDDPNRVEAVRHVLRMTLAAGQPLLPRARTVLSLAERQRIALARDKAVEVQRAINEGARDLADAIERSAEALRDLVEESSKSAQAMVVAAIGLVALVARNAEALPTWLVGVVSVVAVAGVVVTANSRIRRVNERKSALQQLRDRLADDPLLPESEIARARKVLVDFDFDSRASSAVRVVTLLGIASAVIVIAAAVWLVNQDVDAPDDPPAATTTMVP